MKKIKAIQLRKYRPSSPHQSKSFACILGCLIDNGNSATYEQLVAAVPKDHPEPSNVPAGKARAEAHIKWHLGERGTSHKPTLRWV